MVDTAIRFVVERNPFYHRVDANGVQLPYIDRVIVNQADGKLIPAKAAAGEVDLQARNLSFKDFTFLKENEMLKPVLDNALLASAYAHAALAADSDRYAAVARSTAREPMMTS